VLGEVEERRKSFVHSQPSSLSQKSQHEQAIHSLRTIVAKFVPDSEKLAEVSAFISASEDDLFSRKSRLNSDISAFLRAREKESLLSQLKVILDREEEGGVEKKLKEVEKLISEASEL